MIWAAGMKNELKLPHVQFAGTYKETHREGR